MRTARRLLWLLLLAAALFAATRVWLPMYSIGPGPAKEVAPLIHVSGMPVYGSQGRFVMTSVRIERLTPIGLLGAWLDPNREVVERSQLYPPDRTDEEERQRAVSEMDQSKLDATYLVLSRLTGYPKEHGRGVLVERVVEGCAADGELFPGDLVLAIDGQRVATVRAASKLIEAVPSGSSLAFEIRAGGTRQTIELVRRPCGGGEDPLVGVSMIPSFPFGVRIDSGGIGGPSAGLMWAVALHDLLTPDDLTGGRMVAGTGVLGLNGTVYPIGGIAEKIVAAERAGADLFLLPEDNLEEARAAGAEGIRLVPVASFDDVLEFLRNGS